MARLTRNRQFRDPSKLTDYEEKILALRQSGMGWKEIAAELGNVNERSVAVRYQIIKDKLRVMNG